MKQENNVVKGWFSRGVSLWKSLASRNVLLLANEVAPAAVLAKDTFFSNILVSDLQDQLGTLIQADPRFKSTDDTKGFGCGPWTCGIEIPEQDDIEDSYTAYVCVNGKKLAIDFDIVDGQAVLSTDDPYPVTQSTIFTPDAQANEAAAKQKPNGAEAALAGKQATATAKEASDAAHAATQVAGEADTRETHAAAAKLHKEASKANDDAAQVYQSNPFMADTHSRLADTHQEQAEVHQKAADGNPRVEKKISQDAKQVSTQASAASKYAAEADTPEAHGTAGAENEHAAEVHMQAAKAFAPSDPLTANYHEGQAVVHQKNAEYHASKCGESQTPEAKVANEVAFWTCLRARLGDARATAAAADLMEPDVAIDRFIANAGGNENALTSIAPSQTPTVKLGDRDIGPQFLKISQSDDGFSQNCMAASNAALAASAKLKATGKNANAQDYADAADAHQKAAALYAGRSLGNPELMDDYVSMEQTHRYMGESIDKDAVAAGFKPKRGLGPNIDLKVGNEAMLANGGPGSGPRAKGDGEPLSDTVVRASEASHQAWKATRDADKANDPDLHENAAKLHRTAADLRQVVADKSRQEDQNGMGERQGRAADYARQDHLDSAVRHESMVKGDKANEGTSEGASKGWESRRSGASSSASEASQAAATATQKAHNSDSPEDHATARDSHATAQAAHEKAAKLETNAEPYQAKGFHESVAGAHKAAVEYHGHKISQINGNQKLAQGAPFTEIGGVMHIPDQPESKVAEAASEKAWKSGKTEDHAAAATAHEKAEKVHLAKKVTLRASAEKLPFGAPENRAADLHMYKAGGHENSAGIHRLIAENPKDLAGMAKRETPEPKANEAEMANEGVIVEFPTGLLIEAANEANPNSNWIQISPYGDFPHTEGLQRFTKDDAQVIVNEFNGPTSILKRTLGMGIPFYVGHPDHEKFKQRYTDTRAYGRVKALEAREDGIWGNVKWTTAGKNMVNEEQFHGHSVNWAVKMGEDGAYHPCRIKSIGFTNEPNIPVKPITRANEQNDEIENDLQQKAA